MAYVPGCRSEMGFQNQANLMDMVRCSFHAERISIYRRYGEIYMYVFIYIESSITKATVAHGKAMERYLSMAVGPFIFCNREVFV